MGSPWSTNARRSRWVSKALSNAGWHRDRAEAERVSTGESSIPRTVSGSSTPFAEVTVKRRRPPGLLRGPAVVDHRAVRPERREARSEPGFHSVEHLAHRRAVDAVDDLLLPATSRRPGAADATVTPGRGNRGDFRIHRRPAVLRDDHVRGGDASSSGPWSTRAGRGHDGDRGHEHHADHQRAGGDGRVPGMAHRVAAGQPPGGAADGGRGSAERRGRGGEREGKEEGGRGAVLCGEG